MLIESSEPPARCDLLRSSPKLRPSQAWTAARSSRRSSGLHVDPSSRSSMVVSTCFHRCANSPTVWRRRVVNRHCSNNASCEWADEMSRTDPPPSTADVLAVEDDLIRAIAILIRSGSAEHDDLDRARSSTTHCVPTCVIDAASRRSSRCCSACREASEREPDNRERLDDVIEMLRVTAMAHSDAGSSAAANRLLDEATTLVDRSSQPQAHLARIESLRAGLSFEFGDLVAARSYATSAIDSARQAGDDIARHTATRVLSDVALETGELDDALVMVKSVVRDVPPSLTWLRGYALAAVGACELERGASAIAVSAAHQIAIDALERGDRDLLVEADWLAAMADPRRATCPSHPSRRRPNRQLGHPHPGRHRHRTSPTRGRCTRLGDHACGRLRTPRQRPADAIARNRRPTPGRRGRRRTRLDR